MFDEGFRSRAERAAACDLTMRALQRLRFVIRGFERGARGGMWLNLTKRFP